MTYRELFGTAVNLLEKAENDSPEYEVRELMKYYFGITRLSYAVLKNDKADAENAVRFLDAVKKRSEGYPLQYLLKSWTFMDCEFTVGEGVLIPRDDTEVCVRECMSRMEKSRMTAPVIIDLCSGSGAIAVSLAKKYPDAYIIAAELSEKAYGYLLENIEINSCAGIIHPVRADIAELYNEYEDGYFDVIISNPPYIKTDELPTLQKEVQFEPKIALDGGSDGLFFYRIIAEKWLSKLKKGGIISLEIGEQQGQDVSSLLKHQGLKETSIIYDISGLERTVISQK